MKFTNGFWRVRDGFTVFSAGQAYDAREHNGALEVYAPIKPVTQRGDVLNAPQLTFEVSAPAPDVLKVRLSHFQGGNSLLPEFVLAQGRNTAAKVVVDESRAEITSGRLTAHFDRGLVPWNLEFRVDGQLLTRSESKGPSWVTGPEGRTWMKEELSLDVGESVYGLGERFGAFLKNGQIRGELRGVLGAAEYESLTKHRDLGTKEMTSVAAVDGLIIILIIIGNFSYFSSRRAGRENA